MKCRHKTSLLCLALIVSVSGCNPLTCSTSKGTSMQHAEQEVTTASGLRYTIVTPGDANGAVAQSGNLVKVHYTGWLQQKDGSKGTQFDSSVKRGQPFEFPLGAGMVIKGWDEGVAGMRVGETRILIIPANLGYGARGAGAVIPPNATLIFEVSLLEVK